MRDHRNMTKYDLVIIGGGAAGLAAAASFIKETGGGTGGQASSICILEKNASPGRKINATGGGRCNLTNAACPGKDMTLEFFRGLGIETWQDHEGRYYPYTNKASDVTKALLDRISDETEGVRVRLQCGFTVRVVSRVCYEDEEDSCFMITGSHTAGSDASGETEMIFADRVLIAMGGKAGPQYGTTGDGYTIARTLGHTVTRVFPILTGISCRSRTTADSKAAPVDFAALKGVRAKGTVILHRDGAPVARDTGEIQFTEDGLSGICVFNLTPHIRAGKNEKFTEAMKRYTLTVDLAPDFTEEELSGRDSAFGILTDKLAGALADAGVLDEGVAGIKHWELDITGVKGWRDAQATFGGVALDEIDMETMESQRVPGLYFAGEILDAQGPCGGFNLQNAWETGIKAARAVVGSLQSAGESESDRED